MRHLTIILITILINQGILAQNLKGVITDVKEQRPLPYATIIINDTENNFIDGASTTEDGYFELEISSGNYKIRVDFIGYKTYSSSITIDSGIIREMNIKLEVDESQLDEVTVVAERTTVQQLIDKKVINVGKDLLAAGGSAATVLSQLSEVRADENGNISLLGSRNVNVLINGKPSPLSTSEILQQIPADEINKIEIITTAYRDYAIDAFEEAVVDFLLKPFAYERFLKAVIRIQNTLTPSNSNLNNDEFFVYADKTFHRMDKNDILLIKAEVDYVHIIETTKKVLVQDSLNNWNNKLKDSGFVRVHRSFIINFNRIDKVAGNQIFIEEHIIPIGNTYRAAFFELVKK